MVDQASIRQCTQTPSSPHSCPGLVNHIEDIALRVLEGDEVFTGLRGSGIAGRSQLEQPSHLLLLVFGVQIEVQAVLPDSLLRNQLQGHVDVSSFGIPEDDPALLRWISWEVSQRRLPKRQHAGKVIAVDHDRSDVHGDTSVRPAGPSLGWYPDCRGRVSADDPVCAPACIMSLPRVASSTGVTTSQVQWGTSRVSTIARASIR